MSIQFERVDFSLKKQVIDGMRNAIVDGSFSPGQKLVERELCQLFDVSRSLMREVLQQLEAEALITIVPFRGPMVAEIRLDEAKSIYAVRQALEALAGAGCAQNASDSDIAALQANLAIIVQFADGADPKSVVRAKNEFYNVLLSACGNPVVKDILTGLNNRINSLRRVSMAQPGRLVDTARELQDIIDAIRNRNADLASKLCADHVGKAAAIALEVMAREQGVSQTDAVIQE